MRRFCIWAGYCKTCDNATKTDDSSLERTSDQTRQLAVMSILENGLRDSNAVNGGSSREEYGHVQSTVRPQQDYPPDQCRLTYWMQVSKTENTFTMYLLGDGIRRKAKTRMLAAERCEQSNSSDSRTGSLFSVCNVRFKRSFQTFQRVCSGFVLRSRQVNFCDLP